MCTPLGVSVFLLERAEVASAAALLAAAGGCLAGNSPSQMSQVCLVCVINESQFFPKCT